tara:strand:+ start:365 stop:754 length:390 start_codon:yes stop_codon:yes gene_type:complete
MDINRVIAIVRRLREEPERTAEYKAMQKTLYPRGSTVDAKTGKDNATMTKIGGWKNRKRDTKAKRNRGYGAMKSRLIAMREEGIVPTNNASSGAIAGLPPDSPPVRKKKDQRKVVIGRFARSLRKDGKS